MLALRGRSVRDALRGRFDDARALHEGPRFTVLAATDRESGRPVAVKIPTDGGNAWLWDVLHREAAALRAVGAHPNVVPLVDLLVLDDGRPALVLERGSGALSDELHAGGKHELRAVIAAGIKLADALEAVHDAGYIHCDVRPANILLSATGEPLLSGFDESVLVPMDGPAGGAEPVALHVTTPHTAPELLEGRPATPATDVYGLASTLYELVAGRAAFRAYAGESPASVIVRVLGGRVKPIVAPGIPLDMSDLLTWAMAGDPAARPPSPAWLGEELSRIELREGWPRTRLLSA